MPPPTPYSQLNAVLCQLIDGIRGILAEDFVGAYLQGSFAVEAFDEDSNVDFIVIAQI